MNPFKLLGQMPASDSPKFELNALDWQKIGREALMNVIPVAVPVLTTMEGFRYQLANGTDYTIAVVVGLRLLLEVIRRLTAGQPLPKPAEG